jgi:hypothetical protein
MRRRYFLGVLSGAAATLPHAVSAQQTAMRTIGWLSARSSDTEREARSLAAFREGLAQTGYVEGRNLTIELLCVPKTLSVLIGGGNHLTSVHNDRAAVFCPYHLGLAIQVEEPA